MTYLDEVFGLQGATAVVTGATSGLGAASVGVRVANTKLGNIPSRQYNTINVRTPGTSRPETFYFKT